MRSSVTIAVWQADVPATASDTLRYYIELIDGTDNDFYSTAGMSDGPPDPNTQAFELDFTTLSHAPFGTTPLTDGGTAFKVWASTPTSAVVTGQFSGWATTEAGGATGLTRVGDYFVARVSNAVPGQQFKYIFQPGTVWKPDARARRLNPSDNLNTYIEDPFGYAWAVDDFQTPAFEDMIVYQLHVGTFSGRNDPVASGSIPGTYLDVAAHADHLAELGVNVVMLNPITEFPFDFSAGYNPISQWSPEWKYGTPGDLKFMVDTLHANGIAVVLDIVWNHFSPTDNYLWFYDGNQIYFRSPDVQTPWGSQADFSNPRVRAYFLDSALYWLEEFRIDGFRFDSTFYMTNADPPQAEGWSLMQEFNDRIDNRFVDKISIAEALPDDAFITKPTIAGGAGFDTQYFDAYVDTLRQGIIDAAFGSTDMFAVADVIDGFGPDLSETKVLNYIELHDEAWPSSGGERLVRIIDTTAPHDDPFAKGRTKLAYGVLMFSPGIPAILQGTEWLESTNFGGGSASGADRIDWSKKTTYANIFRYFQDIIETRKSNGALRANAGVQVFHVNNTDKVIAWQRFDASGNVIVVAANFGNSDCFGYQIGMPHSGDWYEIMSSDDVQYDGSGLLNGNPVPADGAPHDGLPASVSLTLPRMGVVVLRDSPPAGFCPGDLDGDQDVDLDDLTLLLQNFAGGAGGDIDGDGDTDLDDLTLLLQNFGTVCV
jgi:1,4-alpha-glucan branching enzyme